MSNPFVPLHRQWPDRPARAGDNPVVWPQMYVIWQGDTLPTEPEDRDRWQTSEGEFERREGRWWPVIDALTGDVYGDRNAPPVPPHKDPEEPPWMTLENKPGEQYGYPKDVDL